MRSMHYAVDQLDLDNIFPVVQATPSNSIPTSMDVQKCLDVLKDSELNPFQLQAITSILDASCLKVRGRGGTISIHHQHTGCQLFQGGGTGMLCRSPLWYWGRLAVARPVR